MFPLRGKSSAKYGLLSGLSGRLCGPCNVHTAGSRCVGNVHLGLLRMGRCPFISTEAPVCGKTLWGGGWKEVRRKPQKSNSAWVVAQKQNSMLVQDSSIPTFQSKKDRRKDMVFKRGHSLLSSFQCVCVAGLVVCLLGLLAVILDQCSRAKRRAGISDQCGPWPLRYKKEVWFRSQVSGMG